MNRGRWFGSALTWVLVTLISVSVGGHALADQPFSGLFKGLRRLTRGVKEKAFEQDRPNMVQNPTVEDLADQIDWLEHHIEIYGSAVPKKPDVWGEARLTRHREDVEEQLVARLNQFDQTLQASLRRTDQAALALAMSLGNPPAAGESALPNLGIGLISIGDDSIVERVAPLGANNVAFAQRTATETNPLSVELEPTVHNDQLFRYLNALNELRRVNEGDDTADSPGYSLNLMRIPVSLLPGKRTREGYGAEVSFSIDPQLGDDLLPNTFRQLVINDQVDQLALPMVRNLERYPASATPTLPLSKLKAIVRGERMAQPAIEALNKRVDALESESQVHSNLRPLYQYAVGHMEYWRQRLVELNALRVRQAELGAESEDALTIVTMSKTEIEIAGVTYSVETTIDLDTSLDRLPGLFKNRFAIAPLTMQLSSTENGDVIGPFTLEVFVCEVKLDTPVQPGDLPYELFLPIGDVLGREKSGALGRLLKASGLHHLDTDFQTKISAAGIQNLPALSKALLAMDYDFATDPDAVQNATILESLLDQFSNSTRLRIFMDYFDPSILKELQNAKGNLTTSSLMTDKATFVNLLEASDNTTSDVPKTWVDHVGAFLNVDTTALTKDATTKIAELDKKLLYGGGTDDGSSPIYLGEVSDSADRVVLVDPFISSSVDGPAAPHRGRRSLQPVSPSQFAGVYGYEFLLQIASSTERTLLSSHPNNGNDRLLIDVRRVLADELSAAYDFLSQDHSQALQLWQLASDELASAIRMNDLATVRHIRERYITQLPQGVRVSAIGALGWSIIVESSLLNARLIEDMQDLSTNKGCGCGDVRGYQFFGSNPPAESRNAFNEYVQCRWPIQVFALDPSIQEQNFADSFSSRRELQLAAAIAVANGEMSSARAAQFVRRLETDLQTIGVNRTQIGFSHGESTFGWRFYPRIQSPSTPTALGAFAETITGGPGRDGLVRNRQLEPGMRECTAVVLMPSFVPYVMLSSRTNWFHLTNPADKELTLNDTMKLSSAYQAVSQFANCARDGGNYRPGDVAQLRKVVHDLDQRLPLQSSVIQIPYGNTLGGFELFHTGTSDLAPDLVGWYGAPGIDPNGFTTLFLVGKGFSVHETRVIAGGRPAKYRLLSREIMEVQIPPSTQRLGAGNNPNAVDVHVATPYGASSHLLIPTVQPVATNSKLTWNPTFLAATAKVTAPKGDEVGKATLNDIPQRLGVQVPASIRSTTATLKAQVFLRHPTQLQEVEGVDVALKYDAASQRFATEALGLGALKKSIEDLLVAQMAATQASPLTPSTARVILVIAGKLDDSTTEHPIEGTFPIEVELDWQ